MTTLQRRLASGLKAGRLLSAVTFAALLAAFLTPASAANATATGAPSAGIQFGTSGSSDATFNPAIHGYLAMSPGFTAGSAFTVEGWVYSSNYAVENAVVMVGAFDSAHAVDYALTIRNLGSTSWSVDQSGIGRMNFSMPTGSMANGTWNFIAAVQDSSGLSLWVNGAALTNYEATVGTEEITPGHNVFTHSFVAASTQIGAWSANRWDSKAGVVNNLRLSTEAVYPSTSATIPVPAAPLTRLASTILLLNANSTSPIFSDSSANQTLTTFGQVAYYSLGADCRSPNANLNSSGGVSWTCAPPRIAQANLSINPASGISGSSTTLTTAGGSGTGAVSYTVVSGGCSIVGDVLSSTTAGDCAVTATKALDDIYLATTSTSITVTFAACILTYNFNGATGGATKSFDSADCSSTPTLFTPPTPTRTGYSFVGWNSTDVFDGTWYGSAPSPQTATAQFGLKNSDSSLYAKWSLIPPPVATTTVAPKVAEPLGPQFASRSQRFFPLEAGTVIHVNGRNFSDVTAVSVKEKSVKFQVVGDTELIFVIPPGDVGDASVTAISPRGKSIWINAITYVAPVIKMTISCKATKRKMPIRKVTGVYPHCPGGFARVDIP